jgi:hypothetical protein
MRDLSSNQTHYRCSIRIKLNSKSINSSSLLVSLIRIRSRFLPRDTLPLTNPPGFESALSLHLFLCRRRKSRPGNRFQSAFFDRFASHLTISISPRSNPVYRMVDLQQRILFVRQHSQRKISGGTVPARVRHVRAEVRHLLDGIS